MPMPEIPVEERFEQLLQASDFPPSAAFAAQAKVTDPAVYEQAAADPPAWWADEARQRLDWDTPFSEVLDDTNPPFYRWFADGTLNVSYNCLDRHVRGGHGDRVAFHWYGEEGEQRDLTYAELLADVQRLANGLKARGVRKGDVVGIYLPMIPEVVVAMLACGRTGTCGTRTCWPPPARTARPSPWRPNTRCSCSTPPAPRPSPRGSSTPPAATWPASRPRGHGLRPRPGA